MRATACSAPCHQAHAHRKQIVHCRSQSTCSHCTNLMVWRHTSPRQTLESLISGGCSIRQCVEVCAHYHVLRMTACYSKRLKTSVQQKVQLRLLNKLWCPIHLGCTTKRIMRWRTWRLFFILNNLRSWFTQHTDCTAPLPRALQASPSAPSSTDGAPAYLRGV
jgi:hypothetical protein